MSLRFVLDPEPTSALREEITALWTEVSNAGGAVGFVPPVEAAQVRPVAERQFGALDADRLLVGYEPGGRVAAVLFLADMRFELMDHWRMLKRVMVHPEFQGRGYGAQLLAEAERVARGWGLAGLRLTLRGGHGLEEFYGRGGYVEVGRVPGAIRVAPGDDRDDVTMWLDLRT
ncbi:acetyltransferase (GNAT) family protein [Kitasatospora sp. SolWspMP-SS2h]|uniref:GNAT family N-acetyltransferase n=1 Tax=Kitasatospora sp. SolWspMP-SS2h TaxID=1305729 RepID=UPI000DBA936A|nr:GNAT family N-acetyltransferase [Kitasatospora sp. SolWspMP-SS2h]RAJ39688.1 acetyltransferase (GNAT) family protein [Kitasatospora sp. SolWspMP-SS2h]